MAERLRPVLIMALASFRADRRRTVLSLVLRLAGSLGAPLFAYALSSLVDSARPGVPLSSSLVAAGILAGAVAAQIVLEEMGWKVAQVLEERTAHYVDLQIVGIVAGLADLEHLERPEHIDRIERMRHEQWLLSMSVPAILNSLVLAVQVLTTVALLGGISPVLLLLPLFAVPGVVAGARAERARLAALESRQGHWRRVWDIMRLATKAGPAKEVRVFGLGPELRARHLHYAHDIAEWERSSRMRGARIVSAGRAVFALGYVAAIAYVAAQMTYGRLEVRHLVLAVVLSGQVMNQLAGATNNANWVAWTLTAVRRYVWLLDYAAARRAAAGPGGLAPPERLATGIALEGVTFRYPGTDVDVLTDIDLFLPAGGTVAVVGDNGAGKTTLVKLLGRLYVPTAGRITVDGVDLGEFDVERWRLRASAAFQDHARLELVAREAVGVGDLDRLAVDDAALAALDRAGTADLMASLPAGLATQLGPDWPDGVELSGGEWQKVALGRGMMREAPLVLVLDEPTAALDAETEHRLFDRYAAAARTAAELSGTVTVLISHRFSTVRMADLIVVVAGGRVVEQGSHADLLARDGLYAELYGMQAQAYR